MGVATLDAEARGHPSNLVVGTVVGDYRIDGMIGAGGNAAVYRATHAMIGKRVAIKILHHAKSDTAINRFVKEARAVNLIGHPNIVDVFGFGLINDGRPYLVMELLEGETLAVRAERKHLTIAEVCEVLIEVSLALEAAHDAGIVHRDLKPENIFITQRNHIKLLDFGIAKLFGEGDLGITNDDTRPGVLIGTPRYVSPEQVRGMALDGRVDIYSLGVVAFELLAHHTLFTANNPYEMFQKHAKLRPPKPSAYNPTLPADIDAMIGEMLSKEASERPTLASVRERLEVLRSVRPERAATLPPADVQPAMRMVATTAIVTRPTTDHDPTRQTRRRPNRWWIAGVAAGVLAGAAAAVLVTHTPSNEVPFVPPPIIVRPVVIAAPPAPVAAPSPVAAPVIETDSDDEIEVDPVTHVSRPHAVAKVRKPKPHPVAAPAVEPKPSPPEDDDAVRSPFEHKP